MFTDAPKLPSVSVSPSGEIVEGTQKPYMSKNKNVSLENGFGKSESRLLEYKLSKSI